MPRLLLLACGIHMFWICLRKIHKLDIDVLLTGPAGWLDRICIIADLYAVRYTKGISLRLCIHVQMLLSAAHSTPTTSMRAARGLFPQFSVPPRIHRRLFSSATDGAVKTCAKHESERWRSGACLGSRLILEPHISAH